MNEIDEKCPFADAFEHPAPKLIKPFGKTAGHDCLPRDRTRGEQKYPRQNRIVVSARKAAIAEAENPQKAALHERIFTENFRDGKQNGADEDGGDDGKPLKKAGKQSVKHHAQP